MDFFLAASMISLSSGRSWSNSRPICTRFYSPQSSFSITRGLIIIIDPEATTSKSSPQSGQVTISPFRASTAIAIDASQSGHFSFGRNFTSFGDLHYVTGCGIRSTNLARDCRLRIFATTVGIPQIWMKPSDHAWLNVDDALYVARSVS